MGIIKKLGATAVYEGAQALNSLRSRPPKKKTPTLKQRAKVALTEAKIAGREVKKLPRTLVSDARYEAGLLRQKLATKKPKK